MSSRSRTRRPGPMAGAPAEAVDGLACRKLQESVGGVSLRRGARVRRARIRGTGGHPARPARAGGRHALPAHARRRHPELRLRRDRLRPGLALRRTAGDALRHRPRLRAAGDDALPQSRIPTRPRIARATWQASFDSSRVWARATEIVDDAAIIGTGNIPWLLLQRVGGRRGPTGGSLLSQATWIQRIHTAGGVAPSTGCSQSTDAGALALVPYSTDYVFFR